MLSLGKWTWSNNVNNCHELDFLYLCNGLSSIYNTQYLYVKYKPIHQFSHKCFMDYRKSPNLFLHQWLVHKPCLQYKSTNFSSNSAFNLQFMFHEGDERDYNSIKLMNKKVIANFVKFDSHQIQTSWNFPLTFLTFIKFYWTKLWNVL